MRWITNKSITKAYKAHEQTGDTWPAAQNNHIYHITEVVGFIYLIIILPVHMDVLSVTFSLEGFHFFTAFSHEYDKHNNSSYIKAVAPNVTSRPLQRSSFLCLRISDF